MRLRANILLALVTVLFAVAGFGQEAATRLVTGTVKDQKGNPLQSITVTEKGTTNAAMTNAAGAFSIRVKTATTTLVISGVGFQTQETKVQDGKALSIVLADESKELSDVVIVGYGTQKKANLTGATSTVKMDQILGERPVSTTASLLQGVSPGLQVTIGTGRPGEGANLNIRGATGLTTTGFTQGSPLILVDNTVFDGPLNLIDQMTLRR